MADKDEDQIREDAHRQTERRDQMAVHGLRALLILNGGGVVALLAFLQAIWDKPKAVGLVPWIVGGIIPLLLGAAASGWVHFIRYDTTIEYQMGRRPSAEAMTRRHKFFTGLGYILFLVGMLIVVAGAFMSLPGGS